MASLIRFENADGRGPSGVLFDGIPDWVSGSLDPQFGSQDYEDFSPFLGAAVGGLVGGTTGNATTERDDKNGVIRITANAASNAEAGYVRAKAVVLNESTDIVLEARLNQIAGAAENHIGIVGFTDQGGANILASNALAVSGNQDFLGLRWNPVTTTEGKIDLVVINDGTATVLVTDVANGTVARGEYHKLGIRVKRVSPGKFQILPSVDGVILPTKVITVDEATYANVFDVTLRPAVAVGGATDTAAPIADIDWIYTLDRNR
jgi:hypothetical protein